MFAYKMRILKLRRKSLLVCLGFFRHANRFLTCRLSHENQPGNVCIQNIIEANMIFFFCVALQYLRVGSTFKSSHTRQKILFKTAWFYETDCVCKQERSSFIGAKKYSFEAISKYVTDFPYHVNNAQLLAKFHLFTKKKKYLCALFFTSTFFEVSKVSVALLR